MSTAPRTDFYTFFHKGLRRRLFEAVVLAGATDVGDTGARETLAGRLEALFALLRLHAHVEETWVHPLLAAAVPDVLAGIEREHAQHERHVEELEAQLARVKAGAGQGEALALYRDLARFVGAYLQHLDAEETSLPALWEHFDEATMAKAMADMMKTRTLDEIVASWELMLPALAPPERAGFAAALAAAPPPVVARFRATAESCLSAADWEALRARL
jgi:hypothetical protein